jgi:hypothetical protein
MPRAGFQPAIPAIKRPQAYALDRAASGIGWTEGIVVNNFSSSNDNETQQRKNVKKKHFTFYWAELITVTKCCRTSDATLV